MSKWMGKKQVMLSVLVVALGLAVYLNYYFAAENPLPAGSGGLSTSSTTVKNLGDSKYVGATTAKTESTQADYFTTARQNRAAAHEEATEILQDILAKPKLDEDLKKQASEKMEQLTDAIEQESRIEGLLAAKGFKKCVVYLDGTAAHVVVSAKSLTGEQTVQILEVVLAHSDVQAQNVNIVPVEG